MICASIYCKLVAQAADSKMRLTGNILLFADNFWLCKSFSGGSSLCSLIVDVHPIDRCASSGDRLGLSSHTSFLLGFDVALPLELDDLLGCLHASVACNLLSIIGILERSRCVGIVELLDQALYRRASFCQSGNSGNSKREKLWYSLTLTSGAGVSSELPSRGVAAADDSTAGVADVEPAAAPPPVDFLTMRTLDGLRG